MRIRAIVARQAGQRPDALPLDMTLADAGLDSLACAEILFAVEEEFGLSIPIGDGLEERDETVAGLIERLTALILQPDP